MDNLVLLTILSCINWEQENFQLAVIFCSTGTLGERVITLGKSPFNPQDFQLSA
jgi:hypothetical protein